MLSILGLDGQQEAAYRRLMVLASAGPVELAESLGCSADQAEGLLADLHRRRLVERVAGRYVAAPPSQALTRLLADRQAALRRAEAEVAGLAAIYRSQSASRAVTDAVDVVHGREAVARQVGELQGLAEFEVLSLVRHPTAVVSRTDNSAAEDAAVARGVTYRVVLDSAALTEPGMGDALLAAVAAGEQVRIAPSVPVKMILVDRRLALVPLSESGSDEVAGAVLVRPSGLLDGLLALFEALWQSSASLDSGAITPVDLTPVERNIVTLLIAGLTDKSIAASLALSERSVQRHVRAVMDRVGAQSRMQLGWHLARTLAQVTGE